MSNETLKSSHGYVANHTEESCPICKQKIRRVLIAKKAYNIVTSEEPLSPGNGVTLRVLHEDWNDSVNKAIALIHLRCCDEFLPLIDDIHDPAKML
jgi:hypothetical protein